MAEITFSAGRFLFKNLAFLPKNMERTFAEMGVTQAMLLKTGDAVRITYDEQTLDGEIFLACSTGLSITVTFNGHLGSYTGLMPLLWMEDHYVDPVSGRPVKISRRARVLPWPASAVRF